MISALPIPGLEGVWIRPQGRRVFATGGLIPAVACRTTTAIFDRCNLVRREVVDQLFGGGPTLRSDLIFR